jgi:hypothetical protein
MLRGVARGFAQDFGGSRRLLLDRSAELDEIAFGRDKCASDHLARQTITGPQLKSSNADGVLGSQARERNSLGTGRPRHVQPHPFATLRASTRNYAQLRDTECVRRIPSLSTGPDNLGLFSPESATNLDVSGATSPVRVPIAVSGARAEALVLVDHAEARRRARYQLKAVLNPVLLDACAAIRDRALVRWEELAPHHGEALRHAPAGVVTQLNDRLQVDLLVPVEVIRIVISGGPWRRSVARADALRRFAPTTIRVARNVEDDEVWEALFLGVGITVPGPEGDTEVIAPEPASTRPVDVSRWRLSELCWQQLLEPRPTALAQ